MKLKSLLLTAVACSAFAIGSAQANLLISYDSTRLGLFSNTGTLLTTYSTTLANPQQVVTDNSGHVYVAEFGGAFNGNVKMYNIASGAFIRNVVQGAYNFTGLAFNPANPLEIIVLGQYNATNSQLGRWNTTATNFNVGANSFLATGYNQIAFSASLNTIFAGVIGTVVQSFDASTMAYITNNYTVTGGLLGMTGIGNDLYYTGSNGTNNQIYMNGAVLSTTTAVNPFGLTNDGTSLWSADFGGGVAQYNTSGTLLSSFSLHNPAGIAFTAIPEPSTYALLGLGLLGVAIARYRRRRAA